MNIFINDNERELSAPCSVAELLRREIGSNDQGLAVAINDCVVPRSLWHEEQIAAGDRVLIVQAVQGG